MPNSAKRRTNNGAAIVNSMDGSDFLVRYILLYLLHRSLSKHCFSLQKIELNKNVRLTKRLLIRNIGVLRRRGGSILLATLVTVNGGTHRLYSTFVCACTATPTAVFDYIVEFLNLFDSLNGLDTLTPFGSI